ncbi:hypothetical protein LZ318_41260 [Saccharopolyspora indica]|uniref:hypothetical protein n=1 Tax=Saccharopolyspora indica TaxID=1229659 RepID=UPI0022EB62EB|nr:hypothetical protein [Saccharopolyspora indica]MDA3646782.1 hypothetical protein [Saccharopolyspora indica]
MSSEPLVSGDDAVEIDVSTAHAHLPDYVELAQDGRFIYLTHCGRRVAAMVAPEIAEHWEAAEDAYWARRATEAEKSGTVPWEDVAAALER